MMTITGSEMRRHMRRANPMPRIGTTAVLLGIIAATAGGFYWYKHRPVTQFQSGNSYKVTGDVPHVAAIAAMPGWSNVAATYNQDGTAVLTGAYSGPTTGVLAGATATLA